MKQSGSIVRQAIFRTVLLLLAIWWQMVGALAKESDGMPPLDADRKGRLAVAVFYKEEGRPESKIAGLELQVYQAAELAVREDGAAIYTLTADFQGSGISFDGMTASESLKAAEALQALVQERQRKGLEAVSDADGMACFENLQPGMYLVQQKPDDGGTGSYIKMDPYLVAVPQPEKGPEGAGWNYDVTMQPKTELCRKPMPDGKYVEGEIQIRKNVMRGAEAIQVKDTFYAGIFEKTETDYELWKVTKLKQNGTVTVPVTLHVEDKKQKAELWVFETDQAGRRLDGTKNAFIISGEGAVTLGVDQLYAKITLTNQYAEAGKTSGGGKGSGYVRTGDATPVGTYAVAGVLAGMAFLVLQASRRNQAKEEKP